MEGLERKMNIDLMTTAPESVLHYGAQGVDRLYARAWGDSIHFGLYLAEVDDIEGAVIETKRRMATLAGIEAGSRVIEVAGGWGASARYLARAIGAHVTSTNLEASQIETAQVLTRIAGLDALVQHAPADFHALPFADGVFDAWWCQEATVHATDKKQVFAEAHRVLKPGGVAVFSDQTTDALYCTDTDCRRLAARHGADDLPSAEDFKDHLMTAGFADVTVHDWSGHMARHFANLVRRIEQTYPALIADIPEQTVEFNLELWRFGRDLANAGGIGWHCFIARK